MGGSSSIFYGKKIFNDVTLTSFEFTANDLEQKNDSGTNGELPAEDDLILNIPDGCFYRVIEIKNADTPEEIKIVCSRLTISGGTSNEKIGNSDIILKMP
jgi:hypothetical protein